MIRNTFFMFISTILRFITGVLLLVILARFWGPETFGVFMYPFTLAGIIIILVDYGYNLQLVRDVGKNIKDVHRLTCEAVTTKTILTIILFVIGLPSIMMIKSLEGYRVTLALLLCANILTSYGTLFHLSFRGMGLFDKEVAIIFYSNILTFILVGGLVLSGQGSAVTAAGFFFSKVFLLGYSWFIYRHLIGSTKFIYPPFGDVLKALRSGFPFAAHVAMGTLYFSVDTIVIQHLLGPENVGIYQAGLRIMVGGLILTEVLSNVYLSRMAQEGHDHGALVMMATRMTRYCLMIGVFGFVCMVSFSDLVVNLCYGTSIYSKVVPLFPFFGIVLLLRYMSTSYGILLTVDNRQTVRTVAVALSFIVSLTLNIVLIEKFHLHGALYASILTHIFLTSIYMIFAWRQVHSWLMEWRSFVLILIAVIAGIFQIFFFSESQMLQIIVFSFTILIVAIYGLTFSEYQNLLKRCHSFVSST